MRSLTLVAAFLCALLASTCLGQVPLPQSAPNKKVVRIDLNQLPPCVLKNGDEWSGLEVELLRFILAPRGYTLQFHEVSQFNQIFDGISKGNADIAVAGITVNREREGRVDFSHPTLRSSVGMMVTGSRESSWSYSIWVWLKLVFPTILVVISILLVFGHIVWFMERGRNQDFSPRYIPGLLDGIWYVHVAITTVGLGEKMPRTGRGRLITALLFVIGLVVAANLVADLSAFKVEQRLVSTIQQPNDLRGRTVATVAGTTSVGIIQSLGGTPRLVKSLPEAIDLLQSAQVDAIVFDSPTLKYYEKTLGQHHLVTLQELSEEDYAFALSSGNVELREILNQGLLELRENGTYETLRQRFLGK